MPQPFGLPGRRSDDAQVAGVDDDFAKVQHGGLEKAKKKQKNSVVVRNSFFFYTVSGGAVSLISVT